MLACSGIRQNSERDGEPGGVSPRTLLHLNSGGFSYENTNLEFPPVKRDASINVCIFCLLVALAVLGRWLGARDEGLGIAPNFTPIAAVGLFAGYFFVRGAVALLVPLTALVISNFCLESYGSWLMMATVYGSFLVAPLLGRALRANRSMVKVVVAVVLPAVVFYLTTNLAQWIVDGQYARSMYSRDWSGLAACYSAGIPFFRWMFEGDLFFSAILFGAYSLAILGQPRRLVRQPLPVKRFR